MSVGDFGAYYGTLSPVAVPAFVLEAVNTADLAVDGGTDPQTFTLPGSYSTKTNDCIVVAITTQGSPTLSLSGCGATWVVTQEGTGPTTALGIGYACTSGGTTVTLSGHATDAGEIIFAVFSGVKFSGSPITSTQGVTSGASSVTTETTPSLSYSVGQLLVGMAGLGNATAQWPGTGGTWGNGGSNTNAFVDNTNRPTMLDYQIPSAGSASTYTATTTGGTQTLRAIVAALSHS